MLWKCCTQYASKFGKLSSGHRTGKGQFLVQSQRKAMPKNAYLERLSLIPSPPSCFSFLSKTGAFSCAPWPGLPLLLEYVSCESSFSGISLSVSSLSHLHNLKPHRYKWDGLNYVLGFLFNSESNECACNGGDLGLIPESERSPGEGNVIPLQYSCLENSMHRGAYLATVHGVARIGHDWVTITMDTCISFILSACFNFSGLNT